MQLTQEQQTIIKTISSPDCNFVKINAVSGAGKAQPLSEKVLTPHGWKTMGDINIGNEVIGSDGKAKKVIGVFPQGIRQIFKVSFIDGTSVLCDKDHLWTVHRNRYIETKTTKEIMDTWIEKKRLDKRYNTYSSQFNYSIDLVKPVQYKLDYELSIDPYLLGLLLGDGGFSGQTVQFTNSSKEIIKNIEKLLPAEDKLELNQKITYRIVSKEKWKQSTIKKELIKYELYGKLSTEKHIPKEYLYSDLESRKKLYQGLIDSDGYVKNGQLKEYFTSSKQLAEDFLELARSLGMNVSCKERLQNYTYKNEKLIGKKSYRIRHLVSKKTKSIISVEYSHDEEAKCIKIDSEDSLYVTNGFNLTHNTSSLIAIAQHLNVKQGLYISYNKAIATEASEKFGAGIQCKTIHSLAYGFTVKHFSLKLVSTLKARIITERIPYIRKALLLETLSKYFLSRHITIQSFVESEYAEGIFSQEDVDLMKHYFIKMKEGKCDCSHDFYLKLFHILLHHGIVKTPEYELLMLDEAGDVNGTSLEIFRLIKATKRIMVGDSCLPGNSKIKTSTGWKNILSIVKDIESKKEVKVWSYNHNSDTFEFKKAIASLRTGKKQCYKLKTTRSSLECTSNHKIATPYGYKRLDELKVGNLILKDGDVNLSNTKTTLNNDQYQILLGSFLGDGYIEYQDKLKKVGRLNISHSEKQKKYLDWKAKTFNSVASLSQESCEKTINSSKCIIQNQFSFISKLFVLEETITLKSIEKLDILGLAIWVMDDGSLRNSYNKDDIKFSITIDSNSFSLEENNYLVSILKNNFNLDATVQKTRNFYRISFNKENSIKLRKIISPFVHNDFTGKFKHKDSIVKDLNNKNVNYTVDVITSITKTRTVETYDIEVEDNHNFIASMTAQKSTACGILVHNCQNIYSFNNTINGFKALENEGQSLKLTQSFRVSDQLAPIVEEFCHQYLDSTMEFRGVHYDSKPAKEDQTIFYIARTNGGIIEKMIELEDEHIPYNLTRPVKAIFQLPLILLMLSKDWKTEVYVEEYKFLENDAREFANDLDLQKQFKESILAYFANEHADDPSVMSAINLIMRFGPLKIFACNKKALEHEKHHETHKVTITSAHSSKGLENDVVYILPDMNGALDKIVAKQHEYVDNMIQLDKTSNKNWTFDPIKYEYFDKKQPNMDLLSKQAQEEFRLYYVAVTRAKYDVYDAEWLSEPDFITMFPEDSSINLRGTFED